VSTKTLHDERVKPFKFRTGGISGKVPGNTLLAGIPLSFLRKRFFIESRKAWNPGVAQTLRRERRKFNLSDIKPAAMIGSVVNVQSLGQAEYASTLSGAVLEVFF
jgi:hypothetical protein